MELRPGEGAAHGLDSRIGAGGEDTGVEASAERGGRCDHLARDEERGWKGDQHGIDVFEPACSQALVFDTVLRADHGDRGAGGRLEVAKGRVGILGLHGQNDYVAGLPFHFLRVADRGHRETEVAIRGTKEQPGPAHRLQVGATGDEDDLVTGLVEPAANGATDGASTVDDEAHARLHAW